MKRLLTMLALLVLGVIIGLALEALVGKWVAVVILLILLVLVMAWTVS